MVSLTTINMSTDILPTATEITSINHEEELQLHSYFERPRLIKAYIHSTTNLVPLPLFTTWKPFTNSKLSGYTYFRGDANIHVSFTGNPTMSGTGLLSFYPVVAKSEYEVSYSVTPYPYWFETANFTTSREMLPHILVNFEEKSNATITLPFPNALDNINISNQIDWVMVYEVLNPPVLNSGLSVNDMRVEVFLSYSNVSLKALINNEGKETSQASISEGVGYLASLLSYVSPALPILTPWARMAKTTSDVLARMGFSRPIATGGELVYTRTHTSTTYTSGTCDTSDKLSLSPYTSTDTKGEFIPLNTSNDTDLKTLLSKWSLIEKNISVATTYTIRPIDLEGYSSGSILYYLSRAFVYWRGEIELEFEFVGNSLLRQRAVIYVLPPDVVPPTAYTAGYNALTTFVDIVGRTKVVIKVPHLNQRNFLSSVESSAVVRVIYCDQTQGQAGTPSNIPFNLRVRAGGNFEFARPALGGLNDVLYEGPVGVTTFGEAITDLNELVRRPCMIGTIVPPDSNPLVIPVAGFLGAIGGTNPPYVVPIPVDYPVHSFLSYFGAMYMGCKGSIRHKVVKNGDINSNSSCLVTYAEAYAGSLYYLPTDFYKYDSLALLQHNYIYEIEIPSKITTNFMFGPRVFGKVNMDSPAPAPRGSVVYYNHEITRSPYFISAGDDYIMKGFLCVPPSYTT